MNTEPLEIEYKYLIKMPDLKLIAAQRKFRQKELTQLYIELPPHSGEFQNRCRIRKSTENGTVKYVKTFKKDISGITRLELEEEISEAEFNRLSAFIQAGTCPVEKRRLSFLYRGFTCEVDIFPFWQDRAFLEIEVESEEVLPELPPFIEVIKDVSKDKSYRNSALARGIFDGTLA